MQKYNYDVLGIGNAVTDIFVEVEESFLKKNNLVEGTMKLVDENEFQNLISNLKIEKTILLLIFYKENTNIIIRLPHFTLQKHLLKGAFFVYIDM